MIFARDNDAPEVNPSAAAYRMTEDGSSANWAIMALHAAILLGMLAWTFVTPHRRRIFHYFSVAILLVATWYYFVLASNLGSTPIAAEFREDKHGATRQIFYARWVGYTVNFTIIFWALQLLAGVGYGTLLFTLLCVWVYTISHLVGALVSTQYKWGFFGFGVFAYLLLAWKVLGVGRSFATRLYVDASKTFTLLAGWELFLMLLYPIAWAVSEGANVIHPDSEQAFYCTLDVLSQGIFAVLLVVLTRKHDTDALGLTFGDYGRHRPAGMREKLTDDHRHGTSAV